MHTKQQIRLLNTFATSLFVLLIMGFPTSAHAGSITTKVTDKKSNLLINAVVFAKQVGKPTPENDKRPTIIVDQQSKEFIPRVTVVEVNTPVIFPNSDEIRHHVYSLSKAKKFELPLYIGTPSEPIVFDKTGSIALGCNIHDWMGAYIYVVDTPYFGKTDKDGTVVLDGLPSGPYELYVWHPRIKSALKKNMKLVNVSDTPLQTSYTIELKPDWRAIRAPTMSGGGY